MTGIVYAVLAIVVLGVGGFGRWFFYNSGKKEERLKNAEKQLEKISDRPRSRDDVIDRLRAWRKKL